MIYVDSSVVLAEIFVEPRVPGAFLWKQHLVSSRLLEYEIFNRIHVRGSRAAQIQSARELLDRIDLVELAPHILARALSPFPVPVRTLDGLHLATLDYLRSQSLSIELASFDHRLIASATALQLPVAPF